MRYHLWRKWTFRSPSYAFKFIICRSVGWHLRLRWKLVILWGKVNKFEKTSNMVGGNFMRIRVVIDITQPLCRGKTISFWDNDERFISFKYERLPNICYWCGMVTHDDKYCSLWLRSKGSLKVDDQQFGQWIRAAQFNPSRKIVIPPQKKGLKGRVFK